MTCTSFSQAPPVFLFGGGCGLDLEAEAKKHLRARKGT